MKKRVLFTVLILVALTVCLVLTACNGSNTPSDVKPGGSTGSDPDNPYAPTPENPGDTDPEDPKISYYSVSFEPNGGTPVKDVSVMSGAVMTELPVPSKEGASFVGWYTSSDYSVPWITETSIVNTKRTLYAKWADYFGAAVTFSAPTVVNGEYLKPTTKIAGYSFEGYYSDVSCSSAATPENITDEFVYAKWLPNTYTVTLDAGNFGIVSDSTADLTFGLKYELPIPVLPDNGFDCWLNGSSPVTDDYGSSLGFWQIAENITLTAKYHEHRYSNDVCSSCRRPKPTEGITYSANPDGRTCRITAISTPATDIVFADIHEGKTVTGLAASAFGNFSAKMTIQSIRLPEKLNSIDIGAFEGCSSLISLTIPDGVKEIGYNTFSNCTNLTSVKLSENTELIGAYAFRNCSSLTEIDIPETITEIRAYAFYNCSSVKTINLGKNIVRLGDSIFAGCSSLETITVPFIGATIDRKGSDPFNYVIGYFFGANPYLNSTRTTQTIGTGNNISTSFFYLPESLSEVTVLGGDISDGAFSDCDMLETITLPATASAVGNRAFFNCLTLTSIVIPEGAATIGDSAFYSCRKLKEVSIPGSVVSIGKDAFSNCAIENAVISASFISFLPKTSLTTVMINAGEIIADNAFNGYTNLKEITLSDTVTHIGNYAFSGCIALEKIAIPSGTEQIGANAFAGCYTLTEITFEGNNIVSIGNNAFYRCSSLTSITIPSDVTSLGENALAACSGLTEISLPLVINGSRPLGALFGTDYYSGGIRITQRLLGGSTDSVCFPQNLTKISVNGGSLTYGMFSGLTPVTSISIQSGVTIVDNYSFYGCINLTSVTLPGSVREIKDYAFYGCESLASVSIPSNVGKIGSHAFGKCSSLSSVSVPANVTSIGSYAFENCAALQRCSLSDNTLSEIGRNAFAGCSLLSSITIPKDVNVLSAETFKDCTSLKTVSLTAVEVIDAYAFQNCSMLTSLSVPSSVISISPSILSGCSSIASLTLPFVGAALRTSTETLQYPLGYLFGNSRYEGGIATTQSFYENSLKAGETVQRTYYIPETLVSVTVTGGNILYGAFINCSAIKRITVPASSAKIAEYAFCNCTSLTEITFSGNTSSLGSFCFKGCTALTGIILPASLTEIGSSAFADCTGLRTITLPSSTTVINSSAFYNCTALAAVTTNEKLTTIGDTAFENCISLTSITLPASLQKLGSAFFDCISLKTLTVNSNITEDYILSENPFSGCPISTAKIPTSLIKKVPKDFLETVTVVGYEADKSYSDRSCEIIPAGAFQDCRLLSSVTITENIKIINNAAFKNCVSLKNISLPNSLYELGEYAFEGSGLVTALFNTSCSLTKLSQGVFCNCEHLLSVSLPDKLEEIEPDAFAGCRSLTNISIKYVNNIKDGAFTGCVELVEVFNEGSLDIRPGNADHGGIALHALNVYTATEGNSKLQADSRGFTYYLYTEIDKVTGREETYKYLISYTGTETAIEIAEDVVEITQSVFEDKGDIRSVVLPEGLTKIGKYAFKGCYSLTSITIPSKVNYIGDYAFTDCYRLAEISNKSSLDIEAGNDSYGQIASNALRVYVPSAENTSKLSTESNFVFYVDGDKKILVGFFGTSSSPTIPADATEINPYAFYRHRHVKTVTIPDSIISIGDYAFAESTLTKISFGENSCLEYIGKNVFDDDALSDYLSDQSNGLIYIGKVLYTFKGLLSPNQTYIQIRQGTLSLHYAIFAGWTNLYTVEIPNSVTDIGEEAFRGCINLKAINYSGTRFQWDRIFKDKNWDAGIGNYKLNCAQ